MIRDSVVPEEDYESSQTGRAKIAPIGRVAGGVCPRIRSLTIPPPRPVDTLSTRTPKRSIRFFTASIPPLRPNAKGPIRLSARLRGSSIRRRQGALVVFLHNLSDCSTVPIDG